ncbi:MAG: PQQ-like beta-propeller repeat protein [bacterium]|nr:PQQ-like beta-propeller repeat protein [bacterium]
MRASCGDRRSRARTATRRGPPSACAGCDRSSDPRTPSPCVATPWPAFRGSPAHTGATDAQPLEHPALAWEFDTRGTVESSPTVVDGWLYCGAFADHLFALDAVSGRERWRFRTGGPVFSSPAIADDVVYVGSGGHHLYALDLRSGTEVWRCDLKGRVLGSPAVAGHHLYAGGEGAGGSEPGALFAVDREDGSIVWRFGVGATVWSSPTAVGSSLWFGAHDGKVRRLIDERP